MPKKEDTKLRLLAVERILLRGERVTTTQILRELDLRYDIQADRKTIYSGLYAIDRLIPLTAFPGRGGGWQVADILGGD